MKTFLTLVCPALLALAAVPALANSRPSRPSCAPSSYVWHPNQVGTGHGQPKDAHFVVRQVAADRLKLESLTSGEQRWFRIGDDVRLRRARHHPLAGRRALELDQLRAGQILEVRYSYPAFSGRRVILEIRGNA